MEAREGRRIEVGIGVVPQCEIAECVCVWPCVQTTLVHNESQSAWVAEACAVGRKPIH